MIDKNRCRIAGVFRIGHYEGHTGIPYGPRFSNLVLRDCSDRAIPILKDTSAMDGIRPRLNRVLAEYGANPHSVSMK